MANRDDERWLERFDMFKHYVEDNLRFPSVKTVVGDVKLGQWLHNQGMLYESGELLEERRRLLDEFNPFWKAPFAAKQEEEFRMFMASDWRSQVGKNDVPIDAVLSGVTLEACLRHRILSCRQYLEFFEGNSGSEFWERKPATELQKRFGDELFSIENRKLVFETVFPNVSFDCFNVLYSGALASVHPERCFTQLGLPVDGGSYVQAAMAYSVRSRFWLRDEMVWHLGEVVAELKDYEKNFLNERYFQHKSILEIKDVMGVSRSRVYQVEEAALRRLCHPIRLKQFALCSDVELLKFNRGAVLPADFEFDGDLILKDSACACLPSRLIVHGSLDLENTPIRKLPERLVVDGDLNLLGTRVTDLPERLVVGGSLFLPEAVKVVPENVDIARDIRGTYRKSFDLEGSLIKVSEMGFSGRVVDVLEANGIYTKMDFLDMSEQDLHFLNGFSREDVDEIMRVLDSMGCKLSVPYASVDRLVADAAKRVGNDSSEKIPTPGYEFDIV